MKISNYLITISSLLLCGTIVIVPYSLYYLYYSNSRNSNKKIYCSFIFINKLTGSCWFLLAHLYFEINKIISAFCIIIGFFPILVSLFMTLLFKNILKDNMVIHNITSEFELELQENNNIELI